MSGMNQQNLKSIYGMEAFSELHERELRKVPLVDSLPGEEIIPEL